MMVSQPTSPSLFMGEELLRLGAGEKHQQQQAKPVNKAEDFTAMLDGVGEMSNCRHAAKQRRAKHDAGSDFTHDLRLAQAHEEIAQQLRQANQKQKYAQDGCEIGIRHEGCPAA